MGVLALGTLGKYATDVMFARWSAPVAYGTYSYYLAWGYVAASIGSLGLPSAALRFVPRHLSASDAHSLERFVVSARWIIAVAACIAGALVVAIQPIFGRALPSLWLGALVMAMVPTLALARFGVSVGRSSQSTVLGDGIHNLLLPAVALLFGLTLWLLRSKSFLTSADLIGAMTLAALLAFGAHVWVMKSLFFRGNNARATSFINTQSIARMARLAAPIAIASGLHFLMGRIDVILMGATHSLEATAVYAASSRVAAVLGLALIAINAAYTYDLSTLAQQGDIGSLRLLAVRVSRLALGLTSVGAVALLFAGYHVLGMFGEEYVGGLPVMRVLLASQLANAAAGPTLLLAFASSLHRDAVVSLIAGLVSTLAGSFVLMGPLGPTGIALGVLIGTSVWNLVLAIRLRRSIGTGGTAFG